MTVRLRAHHLLCMLTYVGKGYSPGFVANFDAIAARLSEGEDILIVAGPDDVCAPLLQDAASHCHEPRIDQRDEFAIRDVSALMRLPVRTGTRIALTPTMLARFRGAFAANLTRTACTGCEWSGLCSEIARNRYEDTRLRRD
ncbi:DUF1284 domain-containing protein [Labrys neptuniae]